MKKAGIIFTILSIILNFISGIIILCRGILNISIAFNQWAIAYYCFDKNIVNISATIQIFISVILLLTLFRWQTRFYIASLIFLLLTILSGAIFTPVVIIAIIISMTFFYLDKQSSFKNKDD